MTRSRHKAQLRLGPLPCKACGLSVGWKRMFTGELFLVSATSGEPHRCRKTIQEEVFPLGMSSVPGWVSAKEERP